MSPGKTCELGGGRCRRWRWLREVPGHWMLCLEGVARREEVFLAIEEARSPWGRALGQPGCSPPRSQATGPGLGLGPPAGEGHSHTGVRRMVCKTDHVGMCTSTAMVSLGVEPQDEAPQPLCPYSCLAQRTLQLPREQAKGCRAQVSPHQPEQRQQFSQSRCKSQKETPNLT